MTKADAKTIDRLPRERERERYILGCLVAFPGRAEEIMQLPLRATDFVDTVNASLYSEFAKQHASGGVDPLLAGRVTNSSAYLLELGQSVNTTAQAAGEAKRIVDARKKRQLAAITESATVASKNGHTPGDIIRILKADLEDIERETDSSVTLRKATSYESRAIDWAWPGWLHRGGLTMFDGDPEKGKSTITADVSARWTYPRPFPFSDADHFRQPGNVLIVAAEDGIETTTKPRLEAAGADLERVYFWPEDEPPITFPSGLDALANAIKRFDISLAIFDPITAHLDDTVNANRDSEVRGALRPLVTLAQETNLALIGIRHLNKDPNKPAMYRGGGSIAFTAQARVVWAVGTDPSDPNRSVMAVLKSNIGKKPPSLSYSIEGHGDTSRIRWEGESSYTAHDIFENKRGRGAKCDDAEKLIADQLADGSRPESEVRQRCYDAGVKEWTYKQARKRLGIVSTKGSMREGWLLSLPEEDGFDAEEVETF